MKVLIIGQHCGNLGDEGAGEALVDLLLENTQVSEISILYHGGGDRNLPVHHQKVKHIEKAFLTKWDMVSLLAYMFFKKRPTRLALKIIKLFKNHDLIIVSPSGANIGIYQDERLLLLCSVALKLNKKLIFYFCTVGKSKNLFFNAVSRAVLRKSKLYLREKASLKYANSIGANATFGVDTAFFLPSEYESVSNDVKKLMVRNPLVLILTDLVWHPNFSNFNSLDLIETKILPDCIRVAEEKNRQIVILPHILENREMNFLSQIAKRHKNIVVALRVTNVHEYCYVIENSFAVITMRYHGAVFSIKNCRPFLAISYENKINEVCTYAGCESCVISISDLFQKDTSVHKKMEDILSNGERYEAIMKEFIASDLVQNTKQVAKRLSPI